MRAMSRICATAAPWGGWVADARAGVCHAPFSCAPMPCACYEVGGELSAIAKASGGDSAGVRFVLGYAAWTPLQLRIELESGVWVRARAAGPPSPGADGVLGLAFDPQELRRGARSSKQHLVSQNLEGCRWGWPGTSLEADEEEGWSLRNAHTIGTRSAPGRPRVDHRCIPNGPRFCPYINPESTSNRP